MKPQIIILDSADVPKCFIWRKDSYVALTDRILSRLIPHFPDLPRRAKEKRFKKWLEEAEIVCKAYIPAQLPNTRKKCRANGKKRPPLVDDLQRGANALLAVTRLFENPAPGYLLLADALCGMHLTALRAEEPSFLPLVSITSNCPEVHAALKTFTKAVVTRKRWNGKHCKVKRNAVLSYGVADGTLPKCFLDHSSLKITKKEAKGTRVAFPYTDTVALVIGANSTQIREASPYLENASVILLNSSPGELNPTKIPASSISAYNPAIIAQLQTHAPCIAALLAWWWGGALNDENIWARKNVQKARASFGKPDSCYIRVEFDPKKLRDAIRYQVLLSFLDEVEKANFMTDEELAPYRQGAKEVFAPAPPEPVRLRRAEDPEVFLEITRAIVENSSAAIVAEKERFVKKDKHLAAWRTIGGERYLVFPEDAWARTYAKRVKACKDIECTYLQREHWERDIQKLLCEQGLIKAASSGYRYRYDLMNNGTRDSTYVVAVPAHLLEN